MPQIAQVDATFASQLFWLFVTFGIAFLVVGLYMYPRIQDTTQARDDKIKGDLEAAKQANEKAEAAEEAYRVKINEDRAAAHELVAQAKDAAGGEAEAQLAKVDAELDARIGKAESDIAARKESAMAEVETFAAEAVQDIVKQLAGLSVTKAAASKQVKAELQNG